MYKLWARAPPAGGGEGGAGQAKAIHQEHSENRAEAGPRRPQGAPGAPERKTKRNPNREGAWSRPNFEKQAESKLAHPGWGWGWGGACGSRRKEAAQTPRKALGGQTPSMRKSISGNNSRRPPSCPLPPMGKSGWREPKQQP